MDVAQASFSTLPDEVVEEILINCAAGNDAASIAAVAATCRRLRSIIYESTDHHLWRSLFLVLFDDPREIEGRATAGKYRRLPARCVPWHTDRVNTAYSRGMQTSTGRNSCRTAYGPPASSRGSSSRYTCSMCAPQNRRAVSPIRPQRQTSPPTSKPSRPSYR